jgi:hypothetical protein
LPRLSAQAFAIPIARACIGLPEFEDHEPDAGKTPEQLLAEADALKAHADALMRWVELREQDGA